MVQAEINEQARTGTIVLRPNYSWTWRYNLYLLYTLMGLSMAIGFGFLLMGAWMILPYSIAEMAVLLGCMYFTLQRARRQEVIPVSEYNVKVEKGAEAPDETFDYNRQWSRYCVKPARHPWDPAKVSIRSHGEELELGSFLNRRDKEELISVLRQLVPH